MINKLINNGVFIINFKREIILTFIKIRISFFFFFFISPHSLFVLPVTRRFIRLHREKPYNNFLLNRTAAFVFPPSPNSIVPGSNFPSDKLFPELWHSIHGAESCESYYARKTCSKSKRLSSNIYAFLSTFGVIKTRAWITDTQIIKRSSKPASLVCKE